MSAEVEKKVKSIEEMEAEFVEPEIEPVKGWKGLLKVTGYSCCFNSFGDC